MQIDLPTEMKRPLGKHHYYPIKTLHTHALSVHLSSTARVCLLGISGHKSNVCTCASLFTKDLKSRRSPRVKDGEVWNAHNWNNCHVKDFLMKSKIGLAKRNLPELAYKQKTILYRFNLIACPRNITVYYLGNTIERFAERFNGFEWLKNYGWYFFKNRN